MHDTPIANATLRDYFAAHAPEPAPWYRLQQLRTRALPRQFTFQEATEAALLACQLHERCPQTYKDRIVSWLRDPVYDIDEGLDRLSREADEWLPGVLRKVARSAQQMMRTREEDIERLAESWEANPAVAWRWYYADEMARRSCERF